MSEAATETEAKPGWREIKNPTRKAQVALPFKGTQHETGCSISRTAEVLAEADQGLTNRLR
jgi:hypothetical protein